MASNGRFDFVIYGATGFTGQYVVEEVARVAELERQKLKLEKASLTYAVAGRNKSKLLKAIEDAKIVTGLPLEDVGVIEADVGSKESVDNMTKQARVVINCVGPYVKYGEVVVKSCIENGSNHVDISGEPLFLEGMQHKYNDAAAEKGVHIVGACGYDSIPPESGIMFLQKLFPGGLNSVEQYASVSCSTGKVPAINTGTLESALGAWSSASEVIELRKKLFKGKLPKSKYPVKNRGVAHYNEELKLYGMPFPSDEPVVYRTQRYRSDVEKKPTVQFHQYLAAKSRLQSIGTALAVGYLAILSMFSFTRNLIIKYPSFMTAGIFSRGDIDKEGLKHTSFRAILIAKGWKEALTETTDQHASPPDTTKYLHIRGPDPGYGATSLMMVASAMTILREKENCCQKGGVLTPGVAFSNTKLLDRLIERGMTYEIKDM